MDLLIQISFFLASYTFWEFSFMLVRVSITKRKAIDKTLSIQLIYVNFIFNFLLKLDTISNDLPPKRNNVLDSLIQKEQLKTIKCH